MHKKRIAPACGLSKAELLFHILPLDRQKLGLERRPKQNSRSMLLQRVRKPPSPVDMADSKQAEIPFFTSAGRACALLTIFHNCAFIQRSPTTSWIATPGEEQKHISSEPVNQVNRVTAVAPLTDPSSDSCSGFTPGKGPSTRRKHW